MFWYFMNHHWANINVFRNGTLCAKFLPNSLEFLINIILVCELVQNIFETVFFAPVRNCCCCSLAV